MNRIKRIIRHACSTHLHARRAFPPGTLNRIAARIAEMEKTHCGEIVFVVEAHLDPVDLLKNKSARQRALDLFSSLRVWDTEANNGVLIYVLLADRDVELVADRGVDVLAGTEAWNEVCRKMENSFRAGDYEGGVFLAIEEVSSHLARHFPKNPADVNELSNKPVMI